MNYYWSNFINFCKKNSILLSIFLIASCIRFALSFVNGYSNDDHYTVIKILVDKNIIPERADCPICYQPKLYYLICGAFIKLFNITNYESRIILSQLVNSIFGIITLAFFWLFINKQDITKTTKLIFFGGLALNAGLLSINIMGSNDSLTILMGVATCYFVDLWLRNYKLKNAILIGVFVTLTCISKGGGFVLLYAVVLFWLIHYFLNKQINKKLHVRSLVFTIVFFIALVPFLGGYMSNFKSRTSFISSWNTKSSPIYFFKNFHPDTKGTMNRPGIQNIATGYFTFRWVDLIQNPFISSDEEKIQIHRTSLWSQLYGRTAFGHFSQWPPPWISTRDYLPELGRIAMFTGIIYLLCFIFGLFTIILQLLKAIKSWKLDFFLSKDMFFLIITTAFLASSVYYAYIIRDYSSMKSIYIFPGYIAYIALMIKGFKYLESKNLKYFIYIPIIILALVNLTEMIILFKDLWIIKNRIGGFL